MSALFNPGQVINYTDTAPKLVPSDCNLVRVRWRTPKDKKGDESFKKLPALGVVVKKVELNTDIEDAALKLFILGKLEETRNTLVSEWLREACAATPTASPLDFKLPEELVSLGNLLQVGINGSTGQKLTATGIEAWFETVAQGWMEKRFKAKNPNLAQAKLQGMLKTWCGFFVKLGLGKEYLGEDLLNLLEAALSYFIQEGEEDSITSRLYEMVLAAKAGAKDVLNAF